jgi:hypothetical protein
MSYDERCEKLARYFLPSDASEERIKQFAQRIQDYAESELADELADMITEAKL